MGLAGARPTLEPVPRDSGLPASYAQIGFWLLERTRRGLRLGDTAALRLAGVPEVARLEQALNEIARRHETLRTTFSLGPDGPALVIRAEPDVSLPVVPVEGIDEAELEKRCEAEGARPMDLRRGPLFQAVLLRTRQAEHVLVLTVHHALTDAWSWWRVLLPELGQWYTALQDGRAPRLPPLPFQYADYSCWQRRWLECREASAQLDYWLGRLAAAPEPPGLSAAPPAPGERTVRLPLMLPASLAAAVRGLGGQERGTPFMVMTAAVLALLHLRTDAEDVVIGTRANVRTRTELEGIIGPFVNVLALRAHVVSTMTFRDLLRQARATLIAAYTHRELPFEVVVERLRLPRARGRHPLFDVMVSFDQVERQPPALAGLGVAELPYRPCAFHPLDLVLSQERGPLDGTLIFDEHLVDDVTATQVVRQLRVVLAAAVTAPDARLAAHRAAVRAQLQERS